MFRTLLPTAARWRSLEGEGLEHLDLAPAEQSIRADGVIIGERSGTPYGVRYSLDCDRAWRVLHFLIETTSGHRLELKADGEGHWSTMGSVRLPEFDGCIDIDLAGTPFTNTLPVRRLGLTPEAGTVQLDMLYVPFDSFRPLRDSQRYTCLEEGKLYRYEAADRPFTAELPVDEDGLVTDYPTLFRRIPD
ncbi:putative glycolipid-binding domain-containing protein [Ochrobactrum sp. CM-21-5]|nr:putative glycolipid-binding domain-containing protein [Ochrobactrum sp. CM-21-5]MBC2886947.1 putative glycolipid-binding domain-containing protein [Ochrobactrum sp. CM-21-5]